MPDELAESDDERSDANTIRGNNAAPSKPDNQTKGTLQGGPVDLRNIEPWPDPVNGAEVLSEIADTFSRYLALPSGAPEVLALWCAHAHVYDAFTCTPRLNITSPEKQCGKTTLRDVLAELVTRPLLTENLTVAVLFRVVQSSKPTLLVDECDAWLSDNDELRGLLNSGHKRGGKVYRCESDRREVRSFDVFAPAVLCGIGSLPGTLRDRSIEICLKRAKPAEVCARFDSRHTLHEQELCRKLARFCEDNRASLETCDPTLPQGVFNRLADNWRPLFAIAELAGGDWWERTVSAFTKLTTKGDVEGQGIGVMLLTDIQQVFVETNTERVFSKTLIEKLCAMADRPWPEAHRGKPITERWLARQLHRFDVAPRTIRINEDRLKGYERSQFTDAFERYLPAG